MVCLDHSWSTLLCAELVKELEKEAGPHSNAAGVRFWFNAPCQVGCESTFIKNSGMWCQCRPSGRPMIRPMISETLAFGSTVRPPPWNQSTKAALAVGTSLSDESHYHQSMLLSPVPEHPAFHLWDIWASPTYQIYPIYSEGITTHSLPSNGFNAVRGEIWDMNSLSRSSQHHEVIT